MDITNFKAIVSTWMLDGGVSCLFCESNESGLLDCEETATQGALICPTFEKELEALFEQLKEA